MPIGRGNVCYYLMLVQVAWVRECVSPETRLVDIHLSGVWLGTGVLGTQLTFSGHTFLAWVCI